MLNLGTRLRKMLSKKTFRSYKQEDGDKKKLVPKTVMYSFLVHE